jgi:WD40-like Beta Propeller Repeat
MKWLLSLAIALTAAVTVPASSAPRAATPPSSLGGVIYSVDLTTSQLLQLSPTDGRVLATSPCVGGDFSYGGPPREVLLSVSDGTHLALPSGDWLPRSALYVVPESSLLSSADCAAGADVILDDPSIYGTASAIWSHDSTHVAFVGARSTAAGVESGIWVARIANLAGDRSLVDLELAVPLDSGLGGVRFTWSHDADRIAYTAQTGTPAQSDIYVKNLLTGTVVNVTNTASNEFFPVFAPSDDRLAFTRQTSKAGVARSDIFVLSAGTVTQVTNKSNANAAQIGYPSWSPDGSQLAFRGLPVGLGDSAADLWRIAASGRDKAVNLTSTSSIRFGVPIWRS